MQITSSRPVKMRMGLHKSLTFPLLLVSILATGASSVLAQPGPGVFALQTMLRDKSPEIRVKAAEGLARVGGRRAVMILRRGLSDSRLEVRIAVIEALGFVGGRLALTILSAALKDKALG